VYIDIAFVNTSNQKHSGSFAIVQDSMSWELQDLFINLDSLIAFD